MDKVAAYFRGCFKEMKKGVGIFEAIIWWIVFLAMFLAAIDCSTSATEGHLELQMWANTALLLAIPLFKLLPEKYFIFSRVSMHSQTAASIMVFLTSYLGCYKSLYYNWRPYDALIHLLGGIVCVYAGYELLAALMKNKEKITPLNASIAGFGISCFVSLAWEVYEFFFDWFCSDVTQHWDEVPSEFLMRLHDINPGTYALFDTMTDITAGLVGAIIGGIGIRVIMQAVIKRKQKTAVQEDVMPGAA